MTIADKIKKAVADEFKYRASQGRPIYTMEEVLYIVNEVIDEVTFENNGDTSQKQHHKVAFEENESMSLKQSREVAMQIRIINGDLKYLAEKVNKLSSQLEEKKIKGDSK